VPDLRGTTWDHPRAYSPLLALAAEHDAAGLPSVQWDVRSLAAFADQPLEELVDTYDLLVFDHPFIGHAAARGLLVDLSPWLELPVPAIGRSTESYTWGTGTYALPLDAACHVSVLHDRLAGELGWELPARWADVADEFQARHRAGGPYLAIAGAPIDLWCLLVTLLAAEHPDPFGHELADQDTVEQAITLIATLARWSHPAARDWNPIGLLEHMASHRDLLASPALFGYINYATPGFRPFQLAFDAPPLGSLGQLGSVLGGAGIAVSASSRHPEAAFEVAEWLTSADVQSGPYLQHGGQPAHLLAWHDAEAPPGVADFLANTLGTTHAALLRPRWPGFIDFSNRAAQTLRRSADGDLTAADAARAVRSDYTTAKELGA
jgi:multiple sugar transport system substrate-binding protein